MRRWMAGLLSLFLVLLAGCGAGSKPSSGPAAGEKSAETGAAAPAAKGDQPSGVKKVSGKIRFAYLPSTNLGPLFWAAHKYWPAAGLEVEMVPQTAGSGVISQLATGQVQVGAGSLGATVFNAVNQKLPVSFVAPLHFEKAEEYLAVSNKWKEKGVNSVADLKGKPVMINGKGVVIEYLLAQSLKHANLTVKDVQMGTMGFPDMVKALETGAIAAATLTQPYAAQADLKKVAFYPLRDADSKVIPVTAVFFNSDWAKKNPDVATAVMAGYLQAVREIMKMTTQEGEYAETVNKYTPVGLDVLKSFKPATYDPNGSVDKNALMDQQRYNLEQGYLEYKELIPMDQIFDSTWIDSALKQIGRQ